jgi:replication factor C large subunit
MWVERYRPAKVEEMIGNEQARIAFLRWLVNWKHGDPAVLLVGPPGTGKTTLVNLAAKEYGFNLVELNASGTRTKERLNSIIGEVLTSTNLFSEKSLIFLDEIDGLAGRSDYGAVEFIKDSIKKTENPIVMAGNDPDADQIKKLSEASLTLRLRPPPPRELEMYLRRMLNQEGKSITDERLTAVIGLAGGDVRYAINSVQSGGDTSRKDQELTAAVSMNTFFEAQDQMVANRALRACPRQPNEKVAEIYRSVVRARLQPETRSRALEVLSEADILVGRIRRGKDWRLLRYLDGILANQLQPVIRGMGVQYAKDDVPWNTLLRIWNDSKKIKEITLRYSKRTHTSGKSARIQDFSYLVNMTSAKKFRESLLKSLDLDETYAKFLQKELKRESE